MKQRMPAPPESVEREQKGEKVADDGLCPNQAFRPAPALQADWRRLTTLHHYRLSIVGAEFTLAAGVASASPAWRGAPVTPSESFSLPSAGFWSVGSSLWLVIANSAYLIADHRDVSELLHGRGISAGPWPHVVYQIVQPLL